MSRQKETQKALRLLGYPSFFVGLISLSAIVLGVSFGILEEPPKWIAGLSVGLFILGMLALFPEFPPVKIVMRHIDPLLDKYFGED